ncbi:MAG: hypothetical protein ACREL3_00310, partial [Gemmatimonadales bacterium]
DLLWTLRAHGPDSALAQIKRRVAALLGPDALETSRLAYALPLMGKPAPRLQPDFWFGRDPGDSVLPRPGQVTLVVYGCGLCNNAVLRRLKTRLGDSLEVVLWAQTSGRRGPYMPLTPDREAELIREAVLETARLSAKLGVWTTSFTSVPDPDRRRRPREPAPDLGRYQGAVWFVDSRGIMFPALRDAHSADGEAFVAAMADALVRRPWEHAAAAK